MVYKDYNFIVYMMEGILFLSQRAFEYWVQYTTKWEDVPHPSMGILFVSFLSPSVSSLLFLSPENINAISSHYI